MFFVLDFRPGSGFCFGLNVCSCSRLIRFIYKYEFVESYQAGPKIIYSRPRAWPSKHRFHNKAFKARNSNLYYESIYIKYYHFCQEYEDYFNMTNITGPKRILFATLFLCNRINFC